MSLIGSFKDYNNDYEKVDVKPDKIDPSGIQVRATVTYTIRDKDGKIIKQWSEPSRSFVYNYALAMYGLFFLQSVTFTDVNGNPSSLNFASGGELNINAPSGNSSFGIVVGSGTQSTSLAQIWKLSAPISNGTSSGQLSYQAMSSNSPTYSGGSSYFSFSRTFVNNSGATVTVSEIGIIAYIMTPLNTNFGVILLVYDVPSSPISLSSGSSLTITYTYTVSI